MITTMFLTATSGMIILYILMSGLMTAPLVDAQTVRDSNSVQFSMQSDGTIRDRSNAQVGKIESDGTIRDRSNAQVGKIESDGTIRDRSNAQIGKVESDGTVRDRSNAQIGSARGVKKEWAAVAFFFFNFL